MFSRMQVLHYVHCNQLLCNGERSRIFEASESVKVLDAQSCLTLCNPMDCISHQAPLSMEFFRQEYWSGLPFPSPGDLPDPGIEPLSLICPALAAEFFTTSATWEAHRR